MNIPQKCDVAIIGGGPAGSTAAALLAQKGYDVVLLEKAKHPRYTVGESLIPHFWKFVEHSGADKKIDAEGFIEKSGGTVVWDGTIRQISFKDFGFNRPALHIERDRFDYILLEHAKDSGAQVFEKVTVLSANIDEDPSKRRLIYRINEDKSVGEISCRFVIDASGQKALIAQQLGIREIDPEFRFMSVWGYFKDSKYFALDGNAYPFEKIREIPPTTFVSSTEGWGWLWHIPQREYTSVGLILPKDEMQMVKQSDEALEQYFLRKCKEIPYVNRLLEDAEYVGNFHGIRDYSYRPKRLEGPGYFLCGDAAAFIDPIFSEGCLLAFYSAHLATWAIDRSMRTPSSERQSRKIFADQFASKYEVGHALALPRYKWSEGISDSARNSIKFSSHLEQELMHVVSTVTTRNENFQEMIRDTQDNKITSNRYRELERLVV